MDSSKPVVGIIGAGAAGAAAAAALLEHGINDILILEAGDRVGGRIHTHYDSDSENDPYKIELGANWIHGRTGNPVFTLAKSHGLLKQIPFKKVHRKIKDGISLVASGAQKVSSELRHKISSKYYEILDWINTFHVNDLPSQYHKDTSVMYIMKEKVQAYIQTLEEKDRNPAEGILNHLLMFECSISGCDSMSEVSAAHFGSYVELDGGEPLVRQGYIKVVEVLLKDVPADKLLLNHAVCCINWKKHAVNMTRNLVCTGNSIDEDSVSVVCSNGKHFNFDCVVITSSLGHLKIVDAEMFRPPLPERKQKAIQRMGIGTADKIFLEYDNLDFLPEGSYRMRFSKSNEDLTCDGDTKDTWFKKIPSFIVVDKPEPNMIYCWITGRAANLMETLTEEEVIDGCHTVLADYTGIAHTNIPKPNRVIRTRWGTNPLTLGSYSYIAVGSSIDDVDVLAEPLLLEQNPRVLFAGEATHREFYSTVHGAMLSGQREAKRIWQAWNPQQHSQI